MEGFADLLAAHGLAVIFPLAVLEGPLVIMTAAALSDTFELSFGGIWLLAVLADLAGDVLLYSIGRFAPHAVPKRLWLDDTAMRMRFVKSGAVILLVAKWTHVAGLPVLLAAGAVRMPLVPFLCWTLIGTLPKAGCLVLAGWSLGLWAVQLWDRAGIMGIAVACLLATGFLVTGLSKGRGTLWK